MSVQQPAGAARRTPYEVVFAEPVFEGEHFPAIAEEMEARGSSAEEPGGFVMLAAVGTLLRALRPPAAEDSATPDAVLRYGALAFHAFRFHAAGRPLFTVSDETLDELIRFGPLGDWPFEAPAGAGYVQLPRHRVWVGAEEGGAPEAVDGFFWTCAPSDGSAGRLDLLLCTGLRPGRPGIGAIDVAASLPADPPGHWGDVDARGTGPDFANVLPGGDIENLYALTNAAEALKLVSRIFWCAATRRHAVGEPATAPEGAPPDSPHALPPSALPARPIRMNEKGDATS